MKNIYEGFKPASCLPDCWCEMPKIGQFILEPGNTWSNLAFIFCAGIIWVYFKDFSRRKFSAFLFAFLGLGSMAFHGTQTFIGQTVDVLAMYMLVSFFIFYLWKEDFKASYYILLNSSFLGVLWFFPEIRRWLFLALVIFLVVLSFKKLMPNKYLWGALSSMALGKILWNLDRLKILCDPESWFSGHFFWHVFSALAAILFLWCCHKYKNPKQNNLIK